MKFEQAAIAVQDEQGYRSFMRGSDAAFERGGCRGFSEPAWQVEAANSQLRSDVAGRPAWARKPRALPGAAGFLIRLVTRERLLAAGGSGALELRQRYLKV